MTLLDDVSIEGEATERDTRRLVRWIQNILDVDVWPAVQRERS